MEIDFRAPGLLFGNIEKLIQPCLVAAVIQMRGQINAITGVFADVGIFWQKPI